MNWREMSDEAVQKHFNPRIASADAEGSLARYASRSADARQALAKMCEAHENLRYGSGEKMTYDLYQPRTNANGRALAVFIHGGYWRGLDKRDHSFVVPPLLEAGAVVVNLNYDLCPDVTLDEMCDEVVAGVRHCHANAARWGADPGRVVLIGHSAGAHLAARVLNAPEDGRGKPGELVAGLAAISGIYEPQIVLRLPGVNEDAQIHADVAERNDCLKLQPTGAARLAIWAGANEPDGWVDQSRRYADLARAQGLDCTFFELACTDHFTVLERTFEKDSTGWQAVLGLLHER